MEAKNKFIPEYLSRKSMIIHLAIIVIEFVIIKVISSGQYTIGIGLPENHIGNLIYIGHFIIYMALIAAGFVLINAYWSNKNKIDHLISSYKLPIWLIILNITSLIVLTILIMINRNYYDGSINPAYTWPIILSLPFKLILFLTLPLFIAPVNVWINIFEEYFTFPVKLLMLLILVLSPNDKPVAMYIGSHLAVPTIQIAQFLYKFSGREFHISMFDEEGSPVISEQTFSVDVRPTCSGYEGITLILLFLLLFLPFLAKTYTRSQVILIGILCLAATFFMNSVRIALMMYIGQNISDKIAVNGFHTHFGIFSLMTIVCICMAFVANRQEIFNTSNQIDYKLDMTTHRIDNEFMLMLPLVATLGASILAGMFEDGFNWLYPAPILVGMMALIPIKNKINFNWMDIKIAPVAMGVLIFIIWIIMVPINKDYELQFASSLYQYGSFRAISWLCFRVLGSSIFIPFAEELAFRGVIWDYIGDILKNRATPRLKTIITLIGTSVIFGFLHSDIGAAIIAGVGYGIIRLAGYGVYGAIVAHIVTNSLIAFCAIVFSAWSYW